MLFNDFVLEEIRKGQGASFVWNVQVGVNLYHTMFDKRASTLLYACSSIGIGGDIWVVLREMYQDKPFMSEMAHDWHALAVGMGLLTAHVLNKMT